MSEENVETNPFADLVQNALDKDYNNANKIFGDLMGAKINDALEQEKIRLADQIYNGVDPDDEDGDQLELELDAESSDEDEEAEAEEESSEEVLDDEE